ncbi:hypothetical protein ACFL12_00090 [Pseudomonadota bacterium]
MNLDNQNLNNDAQDTVSNAPYLSALCCGAHAYLSSQNVTEEQAAKGLVDYAALSPEQHAFWEARGIEYWTAPPSQSVQADESLCIEDTSDGFPMSRKASNIIGAIICVISSALLAWNFWGWGLHTLATITFCGVGILIPVVAFLEYNGGLFPIIGRIIGRRGC